MAEALAIPIMFALAAAFLRSLWGVLMRVVMRKEKDYVAAGNGIEIVSSFAVVLVLLLGLFPLQSGLPLSISTEAYLIWLSATALYTAFIYISYKAGQTAEAGEQSIVNQLQIPWVIILSFVLLSEPITAQSLAGAALIIAGAIVCTYRPGNLRWKVEGVRLAALASVLTAAAALMDKLALTRIPLVLYSVPLYIVPALFGIFWMRKNPLSRLSSAFSRNAAAITLAGIAAMGSYLFYLFALVSLPLSQVVVLFNTNVVLTAILGALILSEKGNWQQKFAGAILAFIGAALVSL